MRKKLSKIEIATYLRDYSKLMVSALFKPAEPLFEVFENMVLEEGRGQFAIRSYYNDMINIYEFFLLNKKYSFIYDNFSDFLLEERISQLLIPENIFLNLNDSKKFSKKKIIKYIRDAINHNDNNDRQLYSLYNDKGELKIEIFLKNVKPIPFHVEINILDYLRIMRGLLNANKYDLTSIRNKEPLDFSNSDLNSELDKIIYRRYYYKHKVSPDTCKKIYEEVQKNETSSELIKYLENNDISYIDYYLSVQQKLKILDGFREWGKMGINENISINYILPNVIPLGIAKIKLLDFNMIIADYYAKLFNKSVYDIICDSMKLYINNEDKDNPLYLYNLKNTENIGLLLKTFDFREQINLSLSIYYSYLFDALITEKNIKIGEESYPREKIRNSFVHGRWFNGVKNSMNLYDCANGDKNELNYNWTATISVDTFWESAERYYNELLAENKGNVFSEYPLFFELDERDKLVSITLIKNGKTYIYNLDVTSYTDKRIPWGLYVITGNDLLFAVEKEDYEPFFEEMENWSLEDNVRFGQIISLLRYQHLLCTGYKEGILSLEELQRNDHFVLKLENNLKRGHQQNK